MGKSKKGLNTKVVTVFDPNGDEEFEVYVTYSWYNDTNSVDDLFGDSSEISREDIDIKQFESNNDDDLPFWITEDLVYDSLIDELEIEYIDGDFEDDSDDDYNDNESFDDDDETDKDYDENW